MGVLKCNVQEEHNYTGMRILNDMVLPHCGEMWAYKLLSVFECARARVISSTHVQSCKL